MPFDPQSISGKSVKDIIDSWAEQRTDQIFLVDPIRGNSLTFGELRSSCISVSAWLRAQNVEPGSSIAYALPNGPFAVKVILGCLYGGYCATAVNLVSGKSTISYVIDHSDARVVFVDDTTAGLVNEALEDTKNKVQPISVDAELFDFQGDEVNDRGPSNISADQDALLMYTSGTTGVPKGVVHTHDSLLAGGANSAFAHKLSSNDRGLCVLPLYHINGLCVTLMGALVSGGSLVMPNKFSVSTFWQNIRANGCTWFSVVPTQISYLLHEKDEDGDFEPVEGLRFGRSASAPLSPDVQQAFEAKFSVPIIETMGLTETAAQILSNPIDGVRKVGSPGISFGNEVIIADDNQNECQRGTIGEVLVRGPNVMHRYRNNEQATSDALTAEGWLRTGDLGKMDEDGYVFITGRLKELIIKGGENIAPREIDEALYAHPDVIEAAAFACDCPTYGQRVEAGVKVQEGSAVDAKQLIELCQDKLGRFKSPDMVHFFPELPKGPSGKIQRLKLAEMVASEEQVA